MKKPKRNVIRMSGCIPPEQIQKGLEQDIDEETGDIETVQVPFKDLRWKFPIHEGFMTKRGQKVKNWKKRYFVLTREGKLYYFKDEKTPEPIKTEPVYIQGMKIWSKIISKKPHCIKVERYPNPFYFHVETEKMKQQWMDKLQQCGGILLDYDAECVSHYKSQPVISRKDLEKWNNKDVREFMKYGEFSRTEKFMLYLEHFKNVTGKDLETMTDAKLQNIRKMSKAEHRSLFLDAILDVRKRRTFDFSGYTVLKKLEKMVIEYGKCVNGDWKHLARCLSDPDFMIVTYLNPEIQYQDMIKYIGTQSKKKKRKRSRKKEEEEEVEGENDDNIKYTPDEVEFDIHSKPWDVSREKNKKGGLPVKIFLTDLTTPKELKYAPYAFSPIFGRPPIFHKDFGKFRAAILVGQFWLEFTEDGLCIPRRLGDNLKFFTEEDYSQWMTTDPNCSYEETIARLAKTVCRWNATKKYFKIYDGRKDETGNSAEFAYDVLKGLKVKTPKGEGCLKDFLHGILSKGEKWMEFRPSEEFRKEFGLRLARFMFDTHEDIDKFVLKFTNQDEHRFKMVYKEESSLLQMFDRAFWLRHICLDEDKWKPLTDCPFGVPKNE